VGISIRQLSIILKFNIIVRLSVSFNLVKCPNIFSNLIWSYSFFSLPWLRPCQSSFEEGEEIPELLVLRKLPFKRANIEDPDGCCCCLCCCFKWAFVNVVGFNVGCCCWAVLIILLLLLKIEN